MNVQDKAIQYPTQAKIKRWYWYLLILGIAIVVGGIVLMVFT
jgi:hypothetical protein